jgi:hypothetical protein
MLNETATVAERAPKRQYERTVLGQFTVLLQFGESPKLAVNRDLEIGDFLSDLDFPSVIACTGISMRIRAVLMIMGTLLPAVRICCSPMLIGMMRRFSTANAMMVARIRNCLRVRLDYRLATVFVPGSGHACRFTTGCKGQQTGAE